MIMASQDPKLVSILIRKISSWLTVSNQIVKSLSLSYKKFYFFDMVQPIDLYFCKMVEIIEQNIFNHADFLFRSLFCFSGQINIFS